MIEFIIICSLAFYGSKVAQGNGMILYSMSFTLARWFDRKNRFIRLFQYPLYDCPICMPSIWGTIAYWLNIYTERSPTGHDLLLWPLSIFSMSAVVYILMFQFPIDND
jgi:hypothetical protein